MFFDRLIIAFLYISPGKVKGILEKRCVCHNPFLLGDHIFTGDYFNLSGGRNI